ncbi:uncharacterized protein N7458_007954 [Penicillium daleae]|uniref:Uncharacterized protein n=1 Tax=Penicillium daleae TaxID=63821 RepID=A0AAD6C2Y5_9EURO|nr:uncharacterized protein N7458_007954 [Penicillium daleae]KAJ5444082.1 hypothetical protein N7458_007954 [Penicillium daleae]
MESHIRTRTRARACDGDGDGDDDDDDNDQDAKPVSGFARLGLDVPTVVVMLKGSLPPTIAIAMYQSSVVSGYFLTFGYFIADS